jgi:hypothetical protein
MGRMMGQWLRVVACGILGTLPLLAQDSGNTTANSKLAIADPQNILALGTGHSLTRENGMDFTTDAVDANDDGKLELFTFFARPDDSLEDDNRSWQIDFRAPVPIGIGTTALNAVNGFHIIGDVNTGGGGFAENECNGTGTLTLTTLVINPSALPGRDVIQKVAGTFTARDCKATFGERTGNLSGEFTYERLAAGDGGDGDGGEEPPPPPPPPFQIVFPSDFAIDPVRISNSGTATVPFDVAIDSTFDSDVHLSVVSTASAHEGLNVSISPGLIPAPGGGSGTVTITAGPLTTPQPYFVTVFATSGDQITGTSFVVRVDCTPPFILGIDQPKAVSVVSGTQTTLEVKAGGSGPLFYQWYRGAPGMTGNPVQAEHNAKLVLTARDTELYWVRVRNACGSVDSTAALVTATPQPTAKTFMRRSSRGG